MSRHTPLQVKVALSYDQARMLKEFYDLLPPDHDFIILEEV